MNVKFTVTDRDVVLLTFYETITGACPYKIYFRRKKYGKTILGSNSINEDCEFITEYKSLKCLIKRIQTNMADSLFFTDVKLVTDSKEINKFLMMLELLK